MKYFFPGWLLIFMISCSKEIPLSEVDLNTGDFPYEISVHGFISNEDAPCRILLLKPVSVSDTIKATPITDAVVMLKHNEECFYFNYDTLGFYVSSVNIKGITEEKYTLQIEWNDKTYIAIETMPKPPNDDFFIRFTFEPFKDINGKAIPFDENIGMTEIPYHNFGYKQTNLWGFVETDKYTYGKDSLPFLDLFYVFDIKVFTHKGYHIQGMFPRVIGGFMLNSEANDSIEVSKATLSEGFNNYIIEMYSETSWQGGMFSTIPGNLSTNLSQGAVGYFYALNVKRRRFLVRNLVNLD